MSLTQLASAIRLDISAAQRFTHTLTKLGYLQKDPLTKRFGLGVKALDLGHHYLRANLLVERAMPYLLHLSKTTEETVNLTVRDDTEVVFIVRFMCRQLLNLNDTGVIVGARMPAYCTASGIAILSQLPPSEAADILNRSELKAYTPHTTYRPKDLLKKLEISAARGYATAFEEFFLGDFAIAAPILAPDGAAGAINISVPRARFAPEELKKNSLLWSWPPPLCRRNEYPLINCHFTSDRPIIRELGRSVHARALTGMAGTCDEASRPACCSLAGASACSCP